MKKFFATLVSGILCLGITLGVTACGDKKPDPTPPPAPQPTQLAAPVIAIEGNVISWSAVEHATGYNVLEGETVVSTAQNKLSYTITKTEAGTYYYTVIAVSSDSNFTDSPASNKVSYAVAPSTPSPIQLAAPSITLTDKVISWSAVEHATGYDVYEGDTKVSSAQTELSYTVNKTEEGDYEYRVVAVSTDENYTASSYSNKVTYKVEPQTPPTPPAGSVGEKMDGDDGYFLNDTSADRPATTLTQTTLFLVGDSTVCGFSDSYYIPRYGYGTQLSNYLDEKVTVNNLALSGRSSFSFLSESNYATLKNSIKEGDYLLIGFGHNDSKNEEERYTNPNLPYTDAATTFNGRPASFAYTLYEYYIKLAVDKGATPVLCTPIVRLSEKDDYSGSNGHISKDATTGKGLACAGGDYAKAIRDLGAATGTTVIDLTARTKHNYEKLGYDYASNYHAFTVAKWKDESKTEMVRGGIDGTHTSKYGAQINAYYIASALLKSANTLGAYVKADISKPAYDTAYPAAINQSYTISDYSSFTPENKSALWTNITKEGWYGTAFGDLGGNPTTANFKIESQGEDIVVGNHGTKKAKIGSTEGIAAAFYQISANKNFTISTTVTLTNYLPSENQTGFGLMLRDDIHIDKNDKTILSNYVAAGAYVSGSGATTNAIYSRVNGTLKPSGNSAILAQGSTHTLKIERENQTVRVFFDGMQQNFTDFDFVAVDNDYMYICLYATRTSVITFSSITLNITGDAVAA